MFGILAAFCYAFFRRARSKGWTQARTRAIVYALCGGAIVLAMVLMGVDILTQGALRGRIDRFTFYAEAAGLIAFGIAWLVASRILPLITRPDERLPISPFAARPEQKTEQT
jgi:hypothetical protein